MKKSFFRVTALLSALFFAGSVCASIMPLAAPAGVTQSASGGGSLFNGLLHKPPPAFAGLQSMQGVIVSQADASIFGELLKKPYKPAAAAAGAIEVATSTSLAVGGGRALSIPVTMRLAGTAAGIAARAAFLSPAGLLLTGSVLAYNYYKEQGYQIRGGKWVKEVIDENTYKCYFSGPYGAAPNCYDSGMVQSYLVTAYKSTLHVTFSSFTRSTGDPAAKQFCIRYTYEAGATPREICPNYIQGREVQDQAISYPEVPQSEFEGKMSGLPLTPEILNNWPASTPLQLPVEQPILNPGPDGKPTPMRVPTSPSEPVTDGPLLPDGKPEFYKTPVIDVTPIGTAANPFLVDAAPKVVYTRSPLSNDVSSPVTPSLPKPTPRAETSDPDTVVTTAPNGTTTRTTTNPDGSKRTVTTTPDGIVTVSDTPAPSQTTVSETTNTDGSKTTVITWPDGKKTILRTPAPQTQTQTQTDPQTQTKVQPQTTVTKNPDGSTDTATKNPDGTTTTVTTKPKPDGTVTTTTTTTTTTTPPVTVPPGGDNPCTKDPTCQECKDFCLENPTRLGCVLIGTPPISEKLNNKTFGLTFESKVFASQAACPAPITFEAFGPRSISYDPLCAFLISIRALMLAIAAVLAAYILADGFRIQ